MFGEVMAGSCVQLIEKYASYKYRTEYWQMYIHTLAQFNVLPIIIKYIYIGELHLSIDVARNVNVIKRNTLQSIQ